MRTIISILPILLLTVSCSTVHISERKNYTGDSKLTGDNVTNLSGIYSNKKGGYDTTVERFSLWQKLFGNAKSFHNWQQANVKLLIVGRNKLEASLFVDTTLVEKRIAAFKLTNGYLKLKRQYKTFSMIGPIIWGAGTFQIYLGLTTDNRLTVINAHDGVAFLFVVPFSVTSNQDDYEYSKL